VTKVPEKKIVLQSKLLIQLNWHLQYTRRVSIVAIVRTQSIGIEKDYRL